MHADEMWQLYHPNGEPIPGEGWDSSLDDPEENDSNILGLVVIFVYRINSDGKLEILWQKRSENVSRFPGYYDISAGGHINLGESLVEGALRECAEEIGVKVEPKDLQLAFIKSFAKNRIAWVYCVDYTGREEDFEFTDGEVSEVKWVPYSEMEKFRRKYAKPILQKDNTTFLCLDDWLNTQGLVKRKDRRKTKLENYAFIDGQNLIYNTARRSVKPWKIDLQRFRVYLRDKYNISTAYYFIGSYNSRYEKMYNAIKGYGYILVFREHLEGLKSSKKGNVDTDIVFSAMRKLADREEFYKILLVSDDGDYWKMVNYFIKKRKFKKLLAPSRSNVSSLYKKKTKDTYIDYLDKVEIKKKIELKEKK